MWMLNFLAVGCRLPKSPGVTGEDDSGSMMSFVAERSLPISLCFLLNRNGAYLFWISKVKNLSCVHTRLCVCVCVCVWVNEWMVWYRGQDITSHERCNLSLCHFWYIKNDYCCDRNIQWRHNKTNIMTVFKLGDFVSFTIICIL